MSDDVDHLALAEQYAQVASDVNDVNWAARSQAHALIAVARELRLMRESVSSCGHGTTGFCVSCFQSGTS